MIAETSVVFAGMSKMPLPQFLLIASLSNLGISLAYAGIGAYSLSSNSFLLAFLASIAVPFFWALYRLVQRFSKAK